jgi:hypothetical protein
MNICLLFEDPSLGRSRQRKTERSVSGSTPRTSSVLGALRSRESSATSSHGALFDPASGEGGGKTDLSLFNEDQGGYLIRFEDRFYFHGEWYPVLGLVVRFRKRDADSSRTTRLPLWLGEKAIPEDWLRVKIVLDAKCTSIVSHGDVEIDLRRERGSEKALIKYLERPSVRTGVMRRSCQGVRRRTMDPLSSSI